MARGRKPIEINLALLQQCIDEVESKEIPSTRSDLHEKVTDLYNSKTKKPIKSYVVMLRIKDDSVKCKTPMGKRGIQAGQAMPANINRTGRKPKSNSALEPYRAFVAAWKEKYGDIPSLRGRLARAAKGSLKALSQLKCIACSGFSQAEVKGCASFSCALYPVRPYQHVTVNGEELEEETIQMPDNTTDIDDDDMNELVA